MPIIPDLNVIVCLLPRYFRRPLNVFCEFIPQLVFLMCLFGYLVALVFYKWLFFTAECPQYAPQLLIRKSVFSQNAPLVINNLLCS